MSDEDWDNKDLKEQLTTVYGPAGRAADASWTLSSETFFKVPWTQVPELVQQRKVVLLAGSAFVSERDQLSLLLREFTDRLERSLEQTAKYLPRLDEDSRLLPILSHLSLSYLSGSSSSDYSFDAGADGDRDRITADMIDALARQHFPPCMRHLYDTGTSAHHLKHFARLQFGLFLKGVGLSIDEALVFWRKLFQVGSKMAEDKFKKDHVYNIRHSYGLEGGKKNYKPKSCVPPLNGSGLIRTSGRLTARARAPARSPAGASRS